MEREEGIGLEFEARKEKKKKKRDEGKASCLIQVCGDEMGKVVEALVMNSGEGADKKKKKKKKRKREKKGEDTAMSNVCDGEVICEDEEMNVAAEYEDAAKSGDKKRKKEKLKRGKAGGELVENVRTNGVESQVESQTSDVNIVKKGVFAVKESKREKRIDGKNSGSKLLETKAEKVETERSEIQENVFVENEGNVQSIARKKFNVEVGDGVVEAVNVEGGIKRKKKRAKSEMHVNVEDSDRNMESVNVDDKKLRKKKVKSEKHANLEDTDRQMEAVNFKDGNTRKKEKKKARAKKHVHVEDFNRNTEAVSEEAVIIEDGEKNKASDAGFSQPDGPSDEHQGLVRGKRFSEKEDKILREAVLRYIEERGLGDDGLKMVLHCRSHPEVKNHPEVLDCWKVIGEAIPWRPHKSVYSRAHILFERSEESTWTPEEYEEVRKFYREHGADWRTLGDKLGRHRVHVKDAWRRLNLANHRKGPWSQEEYQTLFDLVNTDLLIRTLEVKKTKHGMLRDNICWTAISDRLGTRTNAICSMKWYKQLASPLVKQKLWADIDDYRLLDALSKLEASCIEDVDWDGLLEHRAGDVCRQRWDQMVNHIGEHALKSFPEQVAVLSKRYPAGLIEAIEIYDSKPVVD